MSVLPGVVAINTFREAVRDRVLYNLIFFALMMIGAAILVGQISIGIERMVIINLGLSAISIFGIIMAIFIGVGLVYKEMEKRTLYSLLSKPIHRWEFLVGKFAGLLLTLVVNTSLMTLGLGLALYSVSKKFEQGDATILVAVYFILLELALVTALALFFSCFTSPMLSTLYTLGIYIAGVFAPGILERQPVHIELGAGGYYTLHLLLAAKFSQFRRDCGGGARRGSAVRADLAQHGVRAAVCDFDSGGFGRGVFRAQFEMSGRNQNKSHVRAMLLALVAVPALFALCAALQTRIDADTLAMNQDTDELLLRSGALLKKLSLGYEPLLADVYWTRVVQYYGLRVRKQGAKFEQLWPLLDITTTLDPKLMIAYRFGAVFLSERPPVGPGEADLAVELVKRGIAENPDEWRLYQDLGFLYSIRMKDYKKAVRGVSGRQQESESADMDEGDGRARGGSGQRA